MMLSDLIAQDAVVTIKLAQTTFAHIQASGELYKLTYKHKAEGLMKPSVQGLLSLVQQHPMLLHYNEPKATIYVASKAEDPRGISAEIEQAVGAVLNGWRDWRTDLFLRNKTAAEYLFQENLRDGYGVLMGGAPVSIAKAVLAVCDKHGVKTTVFGDLYALPTDPPVYSLLTIGPCYAIAKGFTCVRL